ncbi:hypothetical protein EJ110_NYTH45924 [Nymphaea thermarum]|nr:hypothetical protein EJ110_NYTH45924 [Nymphaea thermarum]
MRVTLTRAFYLHVALLRQAFAHCGKFPTAASRRSLGCVSVPVWLIILSDQLLIITLVREEEDDDDEKMRELEREIKGITLNL